MTRKRQTVYIREDHFDGLISHFDPENDQMDRRLFYEVIGFQLFEGEFDGENTSDIDDPGEDQGGY